MSAGAVVAQGPGGRVVHVASLPGLVGHPEIPDHRQARVPFGDLDFVKYVMSLDPEMKRNTYGMGKYLLRHAFEKGKSPRSAAPGCPFSRGWPCSKGTSPCWPGWW